MSRPVVLGNGSLTVGLSEHGLVHDFYYPYVGLDNLTTARSVHHKIGVWVNDTFSWVDDETWDIHVDFEPDALVSNITMKSDALQIELVAHDFVDHKDNVFYRQINVKNLGQNTREVRVFMHQVFEISRGGRADTAVYVPEENYILDYKGRCALLIYGEHGDGQPYDQFAVGNYGIEGKEGTFRDAEDGQLSGSPVEHGGVDSVIRFTHTLPAGGEDTLNYYIVAADSQFDGEKILRSIKDDGVDRRLRATRQYWEKWLSIGANTLHSVDKEYLDILKKSLMIIKVHADRRGGIIASTDSAIYNYGRDYYGYVWPRDGAYAIWPLIRLGYTEEAEKFFAFCRDTISPQGYMLHKYQPDRAIGSSWHPRLHDNRSELPIQEDETAIIIYMLGEYYDHSGNDDFVRMLYATLIKPAGDFMANFIDERTSLPHASYDLWEQKFATHTYTVAVVYQALLVAADFADKFDFPDDAVEWRSVAEKILANSQIFFDPDRKALRKSFLCLPDGSLEFDNTLDVSSFYGAMMFGMYPSTDQLHATAEAIESTLLDKSPSGGAPRYEHDGYFASSDQYMGNPWFVTTLWMAQYYARIKKTDSARHYVQWAMERARSSGILSEQVNPVTSAYTSVAPLVWSHAELINTILDVTKLR